jgi:hypothetical protein
MFTPHPLDALVLAHDRGRRLRAEAEAERFSGTSTMRGKIATALRRAADCLDSGSLVRQPAR